MINRPCTPRVAHQPQGSQSIISRESNMIGRGTDSDPVSWPRSGHLMQGMTNSLGPRSADSSIQRRIQNPLVLNCFELPLASEGVAVKDNQSLLLMIASGNHAYLVYKPETVVQGLYMQLYETHHALLA